LLGWHSILLGRPARGNRVTLTESRDLPQANLCIIAATLLPQDPRTLAFQFPISLGSVPRNNSFSLLLRAPWNTSHRLRACLFSFLSQTPWCSRFPLRRLAGSEPNRCALPDSKSSKEAARLLRGNMQCAAHFSRLFFQVRCPHGNSASPLGASRFFSLPRLWPISSIAQEQAVPQENSTRSVHKRESQRREKKLAKELRFVYGSWLGDEVPDIITGSAQSSNRLGGYRHCWDVGREDYEANEGNSRLSWSILEDY